jgi:hypothetical protein
LQRQHLLAAQDLAMLVDHNDIGAWKSSGEAGRERALVVGPMTVVRPSTAELANIV